MYTLPTLPTLPTQVLTLLSLSKQVKASHINSRQKRPPNSLSQVILPYTVHRSDIYIYTSYLKHITLSYTLSLLYTF